MYAFPPLTRLPTPNVSPKLHKVPGEEKKNNNKKNLLRHMAEETVHLPQKTREIRGGGKWKAIRLFCQQAQSCLFVSSGCWTRVYVCVRVARCRTRHCPLITISCMFECTTHIYLSARAVLDLGIKGSVRHSYHVKYILTEQECLNYISGTQFWDTLSRSGKKLTAPEAYLSSRYEK